MRYEFHPHRSGRLLSAAHLQSEEAGDPQPFIYYLKVATFFAENNSEDNEMFRYQTLHLYPALQRGTPQQQHISLPEEANCLVCSHLPKGFVRWAEPADVAAGTEENKPEDGQAKIDPRASSDPPGQARNYIHY